MSGPASANFPSSGNIKYAPEIFSSKVLRLYTESTIAMEICNTNYEGEIKAKGDIVRVRVAPSYVTISDYDGSTPPTYSTPSDNARSLDISVAKQINLSIDDTDKVQADIDIMSMYAESAAVTAKTFTDDDLLTFMKGKAYATTRTGYDGSVINASTSGNLGATAGVVSASYNLGASGAAITITKDNATDKIVDLGSVLSEHNVPSGDRFVVIPTFYENLLKKSDLKAANITGDNTAVLRTGIIGRINDFTAYVSNLVPTTSDTGLKYHVFAGVKDATTFASQINKTEMIRSQDFFKDYWRMLLLFGRKVIQPECLAELYCNP